MPRRDRVKKYMRLLGEKEEFFNLRGIELFNEDGEEEAKSIKKDDGNYSNLKFNIEKKKGKRETKKIKKGGFKVVPKRDGSGDCLDPPNEFFPSFPFSMYILGVVKAGKSTLLDCIIELYENCVDEIIFISPTGHLDPTAIDIQDRYNITHCYKRLGALEPLMEYLEEENGGKPMKEKKKILIIMDDCINQVNKLAHKTDSFINDMNLNRRHYGISFIMLSQVYRGCTPAFRTNFDSFCLFRMENEKERLKICEELSGFMGMKRFEQLYLEATFEPRSFLSINFDSTDKKYQYTKKFNEVLVTDDFMSSTMDGIESLKINELRKLARCMMIDTTKVKKKDLILMIRDKMNGLNDSMEEEEDDIMDDSVDDDFNNMVFFDVEEVDDE